MPRASGKTTLLIKESARTGKPIVCANSRIAVDIEYQASRLRYKIPEPISASQWISDGYCNKKNVLHHALKHGGFLVDDLDLVLHSIFGVHVDKATFTPDKQKMSFVTNSGCECRVNEQGRLECYCGKDIGWILVNSLTNESEEKEMNNYNETIFGHPITFTADSGVGLLDINTLDINTIEDINVIVPEKVVEITFGNDQTEKMVCHEDDIFDLRKCCFIAIAKHLYKKEYTQEGIEHMATQLTYQKKYVKIVDKALKDYTRKEEEKEKKAREEEKERIIRERQSLKRWRQKQRRKERYRKEVVNLISDSINEAKRKRKVQETVY